MAKTPRPHPPHPYVVPPGTAYAAREANEAYRVRQAREKALYELGSAEATVGMDL